MTIKPIQICYTIHSAVVASLCRRIPKLLFIASPLIADSAHGAYASAVGVSYHLPQPNNHVVHRALIEKLIFAPQHVENLVAADDARTAGNQQLQQFKIARRGMLALSIRLYDHSIVQLDHSPITGNLALHRVVLKHMLDAQEQLLQMKRLGDKLFRANFKTFQTMFRSAERRHEHDWQRTALFDVPSQLKPRAIRQTHIENHQIPKPFAEPLQRELFRFSPRNVIVFAL